MGGRRPFPPPGAAPRFPSRHFIITITTITTFLGSAGACGGVVVFVVVVVVLLVLLLLLPLGLLTAVEELAAGQALLSRLLCREFHPSTTSSSVTCHLRQPPRSPAAVLVWPPFPPFPPSSVTRWPLLITIPSPVTRGVCCPPPGLSNWSQGCRLDTVSVPAHHRHHHPCPSSCLALSFLGVLLLGDGAAYRERAFGVGGVLPVSTAYLLAVSSLWFRGQVLFFFIVIIIINITTTTCICVCRLGSVCRRCPAPLLPHQPSASQPASRLESHGPCSSTHGGGGGAEEPHTVSLGSYSLAHLPCHPSIRPFFLPCPWSVVVVVVVIVPLWGGIGVCVVHLSIAVGGQTSSQPCHGAAACLLPLGVSFPHGGWYYYCLCFLVGPVCIV